MPASAGAGWRVPGKAAASPLTLALSPPAGGEGACA